ncbi:hypothetical protein P170DRAFT_371796 [Aspergillus steynii IBT 23096]|uniref:MFS general substrate transporter n=1 Tax=Aspergillus steynii IBT 23096 TaxID=1392250 RepID=A0A2I2GL86_9EURO|nr:uncharacterized protein P170DRAFT_371796 [Aspergillus steynii IBT 23096]PLB53642.1 hypothetical protein P170DRAFT_371796 [Aspergillus steynii IBT 23096]
MDTQAPLCGGVDADAELRARSLSRHDSADGTKNAVQSRIHEQTPLLAPTDSILRGEGSSFPNSGGGFWSRWRQPSIMWLMPFLLLFMLAFGGIVVPRINLTVALVCRDYLNDRAAQDPNFTFLPVVFGDQNPQCQIPEVQSQVAQLQLYLNLTSAILSALVSPHLGHISDRHGRTRIMAVTALGMILAELVVVIIAANTETIPINVLFLFALFDGLGGSFTSMNALTSSYVSDCTVPQKRSVAFGYIHGCIFIGTATGPLLVAFILKMAGSIFFVFCFMLTLHVLFLLAVLLVIPESLSEERQQSAREKYRMKLAGKDAVGWLSLQRWNPKNIFTPLSILFPPVGRASSLFPNRRGASPALRRNIVLLAGIDTVGFGVTLGVSQIFIIYAGYMFNWGNVESSFFIFVVSACRVITLFAVFPAVSWLFPGKPRPEGTISGSSTLEINLIRISLFIDMLGFCGFALAQNGSVMTLFGAFSALGGMGIPTLQSSITHHVPRERIGQILGAKGLLHALSRVIAPTIFNLIYSLTVGKRFTVMKSKSTTHGTPAVPSRNALRVLRRLALAGSTVGSFCTVAAITYDVHRRVRVAERIVENKRALQTSAPNYDATSAANRLARMMEAAEAGEFNGMDTFKEEEHRQLQQTGASHTEHTPDTLGEGLSASARLESTEEQTRAEAFLEAARSGLRGPAHPGLNPVTLHGRTDPLRIPRTIDQPRFAAATTGVDFPRGSHEPSENNSVTEQMKDFLDRGRPIDAAQVFLDAQSASLKGISSDRRELAVQAFYVNCKEHNVFVARSVFERLEEVDKISPAMWKVLMFALAKKGCIESVATIYTRYMHKFQVSPDMVDVVLRCLLESHRLTTAKWFLLRNLQVDRDCGLCGAYLSGLWKKTRSIELLNGQLKKILTMLPRLEKSPSDKLFNPVVKAYIEFGRLADAEALVHDMKTIYGLPLRCRTKGLLVYGKALACDWEGVEAGLQEMHDLKLTSRRRDFTPIFDRIFLEYWVSHRGPQIRDFVFRYIDKFDIVPDRVLYKHILEAFVEKGDKSMIAEFTGMARERSWKVPINDQQFMEILRSRRLALEGAPVGFWQMLQAARVKYGQAATSQHILGYDQRSFPMSEANHMPHTQEPLAWYNRTLQAVTPSRPVDQYQKLHKQMAHYMHVGKMTDALKCFDNAKNAKFQVKQLHVELAAVATLLEHGLSAARALVEAEWRNIQHLVRFMPIFFRQIMQIDPPSEGEIVQLAVLRFYELCWSNKKMTVKHHITTATCRRLIASGRPEWALDLLASVYQSRYRRSTPFDGVCMKMFVRAFAAVDNIPGIRWCILTGLARGGAVNRDFVVEVRRIIGTLERDFKPGSLSAREATRKDEQLAYLGRIADLLEQKSEGDPTAWEMKSLPATKRAYRRRLKRPLDPRRLYKESDIRETIEAWDEEYELEAALGRIESNPKTVVTRCTEAQYLAGQAPGPNDE